MNYNFFKFAFRHLMRHKLYTFINVFGLAVGMACSLLLLLYVRHELSYDDFHENRDRLVMFHRHYFAGGDYYTTSAGPGLLAEAVREQIPEFEAFSPVQNEWGAKLFRVGEEEGFPDPYYVSPEFFEMFSFKMLEGSAISAPDEIVLTEKTARQFFGDQSPLGQLAEINDNDGVMTAFTVVGVMEDPPANSSIDFDYLLHWDNRIKGWDWITHWWNNSFRYYGLLKEGASLEAANEKLMAIYKEKKEDSKDIPFFVPMERLHLHSRYVSGKQAGGQIETVRMYAGTALLILLIACINFVNLSTARATQRAKEVGIRKVVGAHRSQLIRQFLGESILLAGISFVIALSLTTVALPMVGELLNRELTLDWSDGQLWGLFVGVALLTGFLSGIFPALTLSAFQPVTVLKGGLKSTKTGALLRRGLVVSQFALSIALIICTAVVSRQVDYMRNKDLGFQIDNRLHFVLREDAYGDFPRFKEELESLPGVKSLSASQQFYFDNGSNTSDPDWDGKDPDFVPLFVPMVVSDADFLETTGMELAAGRFLDPDRATDTAAFVVNERAVEVMGMSDPIGQRFDAWSTKGTIVGVVKDFHPYSAHSKIEPVFFKLDPGECGVAYANIAGDDLQGTLAEIERVYKSYVPNFPFNYRFIDEEFDRMYRAETGTGRLFSAFAVLAIILSCLGLFGLASFATERRTKEIGIRKVLGASMAHLVALLNREFLILVALSATIGCPAAYYFMSDWLSGFDYNQGMGWSSYALAIGLTVFIALLTVSALTVRAAQANPVRALRNE